ncbi:serine/threonine-protein kinase [Streptacidiphilus monticola]|uniref:non-specific serine/threonine protein kinase n=1 Tax=Streptacidiphilus monticola TaxID=2161674 RepID=A0ABW1GB96_9ACTN
MPGEVISERYELLEELGQGGMGKVRRGYDTVLDRPVAVKLIRQESVGSPVEAEEFARRFRREARITARIQHPGVPQVYDAVLDASYERLFLVMELVEGVSLHAYLRPGHPLPISWAAAVAAQVATVLSYAHEVPVIHRDLKPNNILVARDGTVKLLDFGIAALLRTDVTKLTATGSPIGSYHYMAPEQVRGGRNTPATDLYGLGCTLHELLSGQPVFDADNDFALMSMQVGAAPTPLRQLRPEVPEGLEELVLDLLRKAPEARPADSQEVHARLVPFLPPAGSVPEPAEAGPVGAPDPTGVFRYPYAPRPRPQVPAAAAPVPTAIDAGPLPIPEQLRAEVRSVRAQAEALMREGRFAQAAEILDAVVEPAARSLGRDSRTVLDLRKLRAVARYLGGDFRAALPEFEALSGAYARIAGPLAADVLDCRSQAARCRAELGQVTRALHELEDVLTAVRTTTGSDVTEEAVELRHTIAVLLLAQDRVPEALEILEPLHDDLVVVFGPHDELTAEVAETIARIRLDLGNQ